MVNHKGFSKADLLIGLGSFLGMLFLISSYLGPAKMIGAGLAVSVAVAIAIPAAWRTVYYYHRSLGVFGRTVNRKQFIAPCLFLLAVALLSVSLAVPNTWLGSVGVVLPIGIAVVTVASFFFTLNKLDDILSRIYSYDVLLEHVGRMVDAEVERAKDGAGQILIVANAVSFGNISAHERYPKVLDKLSHAFNNPRITVRVICRDWEWVIPRDMDERDKEVSLQPRDVQEADLNTVKNTSLGGFYWAWSGSGRWDDLRLRKPYYQAIALLGALQSSEPNRLLEIQKQVWVFKDGHAPFHMVVTTDRALLFHVLDFPFGDKDPPSRIQVIGSDTGDGATVHQLVRAFEHHAEKLGSPKINRVV
ncbi:MAG: hypothetical protein F9K13_07030 [Candidatus Methylomirabilis oxygeniifera]|uniref:Uncharacterized protein n=1 Tax=Methylomirabilis oxygeniifera TaxID=671143 RepID=D5MH52_METO1|nr:MAG: hypothetical protein F9K13_07030 [Candidatus Methylomirabilis oxyfera]CBE69083.1 membrane protein of unknown function [Candidatus Methylomirabilis oxyfera]